MKERMVAAVLYGREHLEIEWVDIPSLGAGDVLVRVRAALTCGTDVKVFRRGYHARMIVPPALFGHELAGDIVAMGPEASGFRVGDRVVAANSAPCLECFYCGRGEENLCENLIFNNGAYAEYIRIPAPIVARNLYRIPDSLDYRAAALVEPLACVLHGLEKTPVQPGETVVVCGLGPIGLMFVRLAKLRGARVIAIGRRALQLERARQAGAEEALLNDDESDVLAPLRELTGGQGADLAIEAVGVPEAWRLATRLVRRGGTVNFFGGCPNGAEVSLDTSLLHYSEVTCKSSFHHTRRHVQDALEVVIRDEIGARDFIHQEAPLSDLLQVMRGLMSHNGHMKTAILP